MKPINEIIIEAEVSYESRYLSKPGKLFLGMLEFSALNLYMMEHHGVSLLRPALKRAEFRGLKIYNVDDTSYIFCAP